YLMNKAASLRLQLDVRIQVSSFASILSLVRAGAGIGLIPRPVLQSLNREGVCILPLNEPWAVRPLTICKRVDEQQSTPYAEALLDRLQTASRRDSEQGSGGR